MRISKTQLAKLLSEFGYIKRSDVMSFETYGSETRAYIPVKDMTTRYELEEFLKHQNIGPVNEDYLPGQPVVEVGVRFFKELPLTESNLGHDSSATSLTWWATRPR